MAYTSFPPNGFDRADGSITGIGTPTVTGDIIKKGFTSFSFEELPTSPQLERAEQTTGVHEFTADWNTCLQVFSTNGRGTITKDSKGYIWRVLSCRIQRQRGDQGMISIVAESLSFDTPPPKFSIDVAEINPDIFKHPRYQPIEKGAGSGSTVYLCDDDLNTIRQAAQTQAGADSAANQEGTLNKLEGLRKLKALEALDKLHRGTETFYIPAIKVTWTQYNANATIFNPGGYIENPRYGGLPTMFWIDRFNRDVLDYFTGINPTLFPKSEPITWLRQGDSVDFDRTWFRVTRTWLGVSGAHWDPDLYAIPPRPISA